MANTLLEQAINALKIRDLEQAKNLLDSLLKDEPDNLTALYGKAIYFNEIGDNKNTLEYLEKCIQGNSQNPGVYALLAEIFIKEKEYDKLLAIAEPALNLFQNNITLLNCISVALIERKKSKEAEALLLKSLSLNPNQANVFNLLGLAYGQMKLNHQAIKIYQMALQLDPNLCTAYTNLGLAYMQIGLSKEAIKMLSLSLEKNPPDEHAAIHHGLIFAKQHDLHATNQEFLDHAKKAYDLVFKNISKINPSKNPELKEKNYKIKLAYVSGDLHQHPVGDFMVNVIKNHNPDKFEIFCYDNNNVSDSVNKMISDNSQLRKVASLSDEELIKLIQDDGIDVLVDLAGITDFNRLKVFAAKVAPLQIMWIGYFGTIAMPEMDYLVGDHNVFEAGDENFYLEKTYKLPYSYLPGEPYGISNEIREIPVKRNGYITFGAFNKMLKITPDVMDIWSKILINVPNSKLFFKNTCLADPDTQNMIIDFFHQRNIPRERLILESFSPRKEFLDKYNEIDISLDSFPYGGGVTTIESLHMGVPVITWHGDRWMCRASSSYLKVLGYEELISKTLDEYVIKAVELANDIPRLETYRKNLRQKILNSEINASNFVKHFENSVIDMLN